MQQPEMLDTSRIPLGEELGEVEDPFLAFLLSTKVSRNLDIIESDVVKNELTTAGSNSTKRSLAKYQEQYPSLAFACSQKQHEALGAMTRQYDDYQESTKKRRYSIDFDAPITNDVESKVSENDGDYELCEETAELRKRLLGKKASEDATGYESEKSIERQIEDHDNLQNNLLEDMSNLVGSLRQSASAFQTALEEDKTVLSAAEIGVQIASRSLTDISGKLKKYDKKKLGYLFYIAVFLFMIIGLVLTFIIIKLFPAL